jgi:zinc/manganese transport system substrate-binding protein/zinc transport system substrate-binding protein
LPHAEEHLAKAEMMAMGRRKGLARGRFSIVRATLGAILPVALVAAALVVPRASAAAPEGLAIVTTTTDLRSLAEAVGGDRVSVVSLVPPNFDPEEYQPKPQDLARLKKARLVVRVGLDFDLWFDRLLVQAGAGVRRGEAGYVDASFAIAALDVRGRAVGPGDGHAHGSGNPHYWLDPKNAEIITGNILEALGRIDPDNAPLYEANRQAFLTRLGARLAEWETALAPLRGVPLVAYHNSWPYFARRFRLDFVGFVEPKPGVPPSPSHLAALIGTMQARQARIIVRQPHEPEKEVAFLAKRTGSAIVVLAASVGALPQAPDYISMFDRNVAALLSATAMR